MINDAERPVLYVGHGVVCSGSTELLRQFAEKAQLPVTTTLQGLGAFDELSPLSLHMLGMHGSAYANLAMQNADLIVAIGARFDDRVTGNLDKFAPAARKAEEQGRGGIVQFDVLPKNVDKVVDVTTSVIGDCAESLAELLPQVLHRSREPWHSQLAEWKQQHPFRFEPVRLSSHARVL
jgi:acetolactate synthase-1/2/3 large subunit